MNKEEISKLLKDNPIKIIKFNDIEVPVEWLKQSTVNINGDDYIRLQQENQQLKERLDKNTEIYLNTSKYGSKMEGKVVVLEYILEELKKWLEEEQNRLARECSQIYEDSLGKTRLVSEDIFNELTKVLDKIKELEEGVKDEC